MNDPYERSWSDLIVWILSALVVTSLYGLGLWYELRQPAPAADVSGGEPVIDIDLQPAPPPPSPQASALPPGPEQTGAERDAVQGARASTSQTQAEQPPDPLRPDPELQQKTSAPVQQPQQSTAAPTPATPPPSAPPSTVEAPPSPASGSMPGRREVPPSRAVLTWQRLLVARLERAKRYPEEARGREGSATVSFTIDRQGRLTGRHISRSSGLEAFDAATLALVDRSQPFAPPPRELPDAQLTFTVTIRFRR